MEIGEASSDAKHKHTYLHTEASWETQFTLLCLFYYKESKGQTIPYTPSPSPNHTTETASPSSYLSDFRHYNHNKDGYDHSGDVPGTGLPLLPNLTLNITQKEWR